MSSYLSLDPLRCSGAHPETLSDLVKARSPTGNENKGADRQSCLHILVISAASARRLAEKRARLKNGGHDVNGAGDAKALTLLSQEGDRFNGSQALRGLQARVVCVIASQIPLETNVDYLKGMAEFYGMLEDLAVKHQNREGPLKNPIQLDDFRTFKRD